MKGVAMLVVEFYATFKIYLPTSEVFLSFFFGIF
jgi:hypothetical protein